MLLKMNVLILCGEPLFTYLDPNISVKCERAFSEFCKYWCFSMSKLESSILDTIMRRVGPLPSCRAAHSHGNVYCLRRNYPMSKKSATQLRSAVWTTVFALDCKNDFNHRLMCDGCADSSWIWRLGSWRNRSFHDKILALAEIILEILRNGEKIRGFERERRESGLGGERWSRAVKLWSDLWRLVWEIFLLFWQISDLQDTKTMFGEPQWV